MTCSHKFTPTTIDPPTRANRTASCVCSEWCIRQRLSYYSVRKENQSSNIQPPKSKCKKNLFCCVSLFSPFLFRISKGRKECIFLLKCTYITFVRSSSSPSHCLYRKQLCCLFKTYLFFFFFNSFLEDLPLPFLLLRLLRQQCVISAKP